MLPSGSALEISAPYGDIKIKASDSTEVRCVLNQANDSGAKLDLSDDKIILDGGGSTYGIAELTVYLPKSVTLLTVSNNNGDIDIDGVNLNTLTINSVSGDIDLSDITAERGKSKARQARRKYRKPPFYENARGEPKLRRYRDRCSEGSR